jgi:hypothetical protein
MIVQLIVAGCGSMLGAELRVDPASPHPNIDLLPTQMPHTLELDPSIMDAFVVPKTDAVNEVPVSGWRSTLMRGFTSGFIGGSSHRSLRLRDLQLSFSPVALGPGGTAAVRATIRFKASVLDENGEEVERESGEVSARDAATRPTPEAITANASQAVEAMYEAIAVKIVEEASAQPSNGRVR